MTVPAQTGRISIIVAAAGLGTRMGERKQYIAVAGQPVLAHTLACLHGLGARRILLVVAPDDEQYRSVAGHQSCEIVRGGTTRAASVANALAYLDAADSDWVLVHDAARPCVRREDILRLIETVGNDDVGGLLAVPVVETVKRASGRRVAATEDRSNLWLAQTPQLFRAGLLRRALGAARDAGFEVTDEASAVEHLGYAPMLVRGVRSNIKVTVPEDLAVAAFYLGQETSA